MGEIITKTLAEVYLKQGHLQKAYEMFRALSEKDPSDMEIQNRLKELGEKLGLSSPPIHQHASPNDEKVLLLKRWLHNIRERRRG
jgi:DNA-binding SARP family transcriptional activator